MYLQFSNIENKMEKLSFLNINIFKRFQKYILQIWKIC